MNCKRRNTVTEELIEYDRYNIMIFFVEFLLNFNKMNNYEFVFESVIFFFVVLNR